MNYDLVAREDFTKLLSSVLKKRKTFCGCSYLFKDLHQLNNNYRQASLAVRFGKTTPGSINAIEDYALEYLRQQIGDTMEVSLSSPVLEKLKQYDTSSGTEYYQTLKVFLLNERDQTKSAEILCIHRNTLIYRIRKIESLIDADLNDPRTRFSLLLFFYISDSDFLG